MEWIFFLPKWCNKIVGFNFFLLPVALAGRFCPQCSGGRRRDGSLLPPFPSPSSLLSWSAAEGSPLWPRLFNPFIPAIQSAPPAVLNVLSPPQAARRIDVRPAPCPLSSPDVPGPRRSPVLSRAGDRGTDSPGPTERLSRGRLLVVFGLPVVSGLVVVSLVFGPQIGDHRTLGESA